MSDRTTLRRQLLQGPEQSASTDHAKSLRQGQGLVQRTLRRNLDWSRGERRWVKRTLKRLTGQIQQGLSITAESLDQIPHLTGSCEGILWRKRDIQPVFSVTWKRLAQVTQMIQTTFLHNPGTGGRKYFSKWKLQL